MHKLLLVSILLPTMVTGQWTEQNSGVSTHLLAIQFVDEFNGWCVGTDGLVLKTTDGGANWTSSTVGSQPLHDLYFLDAGNGFIHTQTMVYRTTNGVDFEPYQLILDGIPPSQGAPYAPNGVRFDFNGPIGVITASYHAPSQPWVVRHWKTSDFGNTWAELETTFPFSRFEFLDDQHGYAAGMDLHETLDGGQTWDTCGVDLFLPPRNRDCFKILDGTGRGLISSIYYFHFAYIGGCGLPVELSSVLDNVVDIDVQETYSRFLRDENFLKVVRTSIDEGLTLLPGSYPLPGARSIHFISDDRGWACGHEGKIWKYMSIGTSVEEEMEPLAGMLLYPNPGNDVLSINHSMDDTPERILIHDAIGREILDMRYVPNVDISGLAPGTYSITVLTGKLRGAARFVKTE